MDRIGVVVAVCDDDERRNDLTLFHCPTEDDELWTLTVNASEDR